MLDVIKKLLLKIVDDIDSGNSNLDEKESMEVLNNLKEFTYKDQKMSKYTACKYLNISRATFDNYVREGRLPKGKHTVGFKELSWSRRELDEALKNLKR